MWEKTSSKCFLGEGRDEGSEVPLPPRCSRPPVLAHPDPARPSIYPIVSTMVSATSQLHT
eukprot:1142312-Pelagomonas_calceolata.AAC.1